MNVSPRPDDDSPLIARRGVADHGLGERHGGQRRTAAAEDRAVGVHAVDDRHEAVGQNAWVGHLGAVGVNIDDRVGRGTRMTIETTFPSSEAMDQLISIGFEEGMSTAVGQLDAVLQN